MGISVFLSTVSDEFRAYRDQLRSDLTRHNVEVKVQEDFKDLGGDTLDKLDVYIAHCDAVVHLVGDMCGAAAGEAQQRALLTKYPNLLRQRLAPLGEALEIGVVVSYTQWEAWLALYHGKQLYVAKPEAAAPRGPSFAPTETSRYAQAAHLDRLRVAGRYPLKFTSPDDLAKQILVSGILDLLAEDRAKKARSSAHDEKLDEILKIVSEKQSVPLGTLRAILASMGEAAASYNADEIEQKLAAKASEFRDLTDRLNRLSNADPVVTQLRAEASTALTSGLFEQADKLLADAEARDLSGLEDIEALARQKRLSAADSRAQRAAAAMLRINSDAYREAAAHYAEASRIAAATDELKAREYLRGQAAALVKLGDEFGDNVSLRSAIDLLKSKPAGGDRAKDPLDWATTLSNLGYALAMLGARERGAEKLEEAVAAYYAALEEQTRERTPFAWASLQNNLGNALGALGARESGTGRLQEAVNAYHAALEEWTREKAPHQWAGIQHNIGLALWRISERDSGVEKLEEAVASYHAALKEWTRERVPLRWAQIQNNLGNALSTLGTRESGIELLEEAVAAYRAALEERTLERVPLEWAETQNNLGTALRTLGVRESGTARFVEAIAAYRAALEEGTRERVPLAWAQTQNNLGMALAMLGDRETGGTARFVEAVAAYSAALEEWPREQFPLQWARAQHNLGDALLNLGAREVWTVNLEKAVVAFGAALQERARDRSPLNWAISFGGLGVALVLIAHRTNDAATAKIAVSQIETAYETLRSGGDEASSAYFEAHLSKAQAIRDRLA